MPVLGKILSQGYVPTSSQAIYVVPEDGISTYVKFFSLYNAGSYTEDISVKVSGSTYTTTFARLELQPSESAHIVDKDSVIMLNAGNGLVGQSSHGYIEFTITGGTE
jgi:hypothetical protein